MPKTNLRQEISIDALPSKVWKVLTGANYTCQYFSEAIHCDWTEGSPIQSIIKNKGGTEQIDKGFVLESVPGIFLKYKLQDEHSPHYIITTYQLVPGNNCVDLKTFCEGFADTDETYLLRMQQVKLLLQKIKWLAEYG